MFRGASKMSDVRWWMRAALVASAAIVVLFLLSFTLPYTAQICTPNEYTHAKECPEYHLGPFVLLWITYIVDTHNGMVTAIATVFLTVLTGLLAYLARLQYGSSRTQLSAFVFVEEMRHFYEIDPNIVQKPDEPLRVSGWAFRPLWRNSGETQTRDMKTHVDCELRDRFLPEGFKFTENYAADIRMLLGPKSTRIGGSPRTFTIEEMKEVKDGKRILYLWGWVRYKSVFSARDDHVTRYCCQVVVVGDPERVDCTFSYPTPNSGNCSDAECVAQGLG
jgi:hypothetical protein